MLFCEGVVSIDRIADFINGISGQTLSLSRRLEKYRDNHLLFITDFRVSFDNNMSERDLRKCKNRQKMSGGFRTKAGIEMYCRILSVIETIKRRKIAIFKGIKDMFAGRPVIV